MVFHSDQYTPFGPYGYLSENPQFSELCLIKTGAFLILGLRRSKQNKIELNILSLAGYFVILLDYLQFLPSILYFNKKKRKLQDKYISVGASMTTNRKFSL